MILHLARCYHFDPPPTYLGLEGDFSRRRELPQVKDPAGATRNDDDYWWAPGQPTRAMDILGYCTWHAAIISIPA